jgi:pSer/pThr/pTyr-binding forkhead associated (FHA) protein
MATSETQTAPPPTLSVTVGATVEERRELTFTKPFRIGRESDCEVCVPNEYVSRYHAEVSYENGVWWVVDLNSSNGIFVGDQKFKRISVVEGIAVRLGVQGPVVSLELASEKAKPKPRAGSETIVARYIDRYFGKGSEDASMGEHTMFVRQAFARVQTKQKRRYSVVIGILAICILGAGTYALYEHRELSRQRAMAEGIFYAMKSLDVDIAKLERMVEDSNNQGAREILRKDETSRKQMQKNYEELLKSLHVYNPKMTEQERVIMRVARIFGECELDMPADFASEVEKYIGYWKSSDRLASGLQTAKDRGYTPAIAKEFLDQGLPPQFLYLALQESNFDPYVSGPETRKGIAKGMWQFIPETAAKYGLKVGPLVDLRRPDPGDDRHHWERETKAAARYIKDLYGTDAQASGLLVMACYNWGEGQVLPLVQSMPPNPKDRNFWQLLAKNRARIPKETYDYVFYIVSAAAIGENPRLFGFNFDNPLAELESR